MEFVKKVLIFIKTHGILVTIRVVIYEFFNLATTYVFPKFSIMGRRKYLTQVLLQMSNNIVQGGFLKGLTLKPVSSWDNCIIAGQIIGIYERQLHGIIFSEKTKGGVLLDIGAADGYYGVGAVFNGHFMNSVCYDIDPNAQEAIKNLAQINNVQDKVVINGIATPNEILDKISAINQNNKICFVLMDIEGAEYEFLSEDFISKLRDKNFELLIELHEFNDQHIKQAADLIERLRKQFTTEIILEGCRDPYEFVDLSHLKFTQTDKWLLCSESRPNNMRWLYVHK